MNVLKSKSPAWRVPHSSFKACDKAVQAGMIQHVADGHKTRIWRSDSLNLSLRRQQSGTLIRTQLWKISNNN
jgi:hypothetical protein